tara:strand:+ start:1323 stop:1607 length:285 start_codon:yes stop_codon:yes gene_type:complete
MTRLKSVGSNMTEIAFSVKKNKDHSLLFYSYSTPVAAYCAESGEYLRTKEWFSVTTSRHLNKWLGDNEYREVDQEFLDLLGQFRQPLFEAGAKS